jgi:hypothetical protein
MEVMPYLRLASAEIPGRQSVFSPDVAGERFRQHGSMSEDARVVAALDELWE